jgi:uncharacterized protein YybS (DUF2232 family)
MTDQFKQGILIAGFVFFVLFFIAVYIIRAIFNIPSILRLHKAQVRLLEQMAKQQGVDDKTVQTIISDTQWETLGS